MKTAEMENDEEFQTIDLGQDDDDNGGETNAAAEDDQSDDEGDDEEVVVSIGEDSPPQEEEARAPEWVRELRKQNREKDKKIRELEAKLNTNVTESKPVTVGPKPTLESCDFDSEVFEKKLEEWHEQKRAADAEQANQEQAKKAELEAWQKKLEGYEKEKASLRVRDFEDAESVALENFSVTQQGIVIQGSENPALLIYALGKNAKKAKELSSITDPVKFAFAVAKLETQLKVTNRKAAAAPERTITGNGGRISGAVDSTLERLREEALKTGDLSKVMAYKRSKKS